MKTKTCRSISPEFDHGDGPWSAECERAKGHKGRHRYTWGETAEAPGLQQWVTWTRGRRRPATRRGGING